MCPEKQFYCIIGNGLYKKSRRQTSYKDMILYTTISPCMMCSVTIIQIKILRLVIGENKNFEGYIELLINNVVKI